MFLNTYPLVSACLFDWNAIANRTVNSQNKLFTLIPLDHIVRTTVLWRVDIGQGWPSACY